MNWQLQKVSAEALLIAVQAERDAGPITAEESVGTWFSNPAADHSSQQQHSAVGKYLRAPPAAAKAAAAAAAGGSNGSTAAAAPPPAKKAKPSGYGNFGNW